MTTNAQFRSDSLLSKDDFHALAAERGASPLPARKRASVAARQAESTETVETRWNGVETVNAAEPGDWIVTSLDTSDAPLRDSDGGLNVYVIQPEKFASAYSLDEGVVDVRYDGDRELGHVYQPSSEVLALHMPNGFDILAPWGERQVVEQGYLILNGEEVYGIQAEVFETTYRVVE